MEWLAPPIRTPPFDQAKLADRVDTIMGSALWRASRLPNPGEPEVTTGAGSVPEPRHISEERKPWIACPPTVVHYLELEFH
jgi:hypothetical protein